MFGGRFSSFWCLFFLFGGGSIVCVFLDLRCFCLAVYIFW